MFEGRELERRKEYMSHSQVCPDIRPALRSNADHIFYGGWRSSERQRVLRVLGKNDWQYICPCSISTRYSS